MNKQTQKNENVKANENVSVELLTKKKLRMNALLQQWKRRKLSAERKIKKYRQFKKQYSTELSSLAR